MRRLREFFVRLAALAEERALLVATVLAGIVVLNAGLYLLITRPRLGQINNAEEILRAKEGDLAQARREVDRLERRLSKIHCSEFDLRHLDEDVLGHKVERMTAIRREVRDIARMFRMDPENVSYGSSPVIGSDLTRFEISFPLSGSYASLRQFLERVEESPHFLILDEVSLSGSREGGAGLNLNIQLSTIFRKPEATPDEPAPVAPLPAGASGAAPLVSPSAAPPPAAPGAPAGPPL